MYVCVSDSGAWKIILSRVFFLRSRVASRPPSNATKKKNRKRAESHETWKLDAVARVCSVCLPCDRTLELKFFLLFLRNRSRERFCRLRESNSIYYELVDWEKMRKINKILYDCFFALIILVSNGIVLQFESNLICEWIPIKLQFSIMSASVVCRRVSKTKKKKSFPSPTIHSPSFVPYCVPWDNSSRSCFARKMQF